MKMHQTRGLLTTRPYIGPKRLFSYPKYCSLGMSFSKIICWWIQLWRVQSKLSTLLKTQMYWITGGRCGYRKWSLISNSFSSRQRHNDRRKWPTAKWSDWFCHWRPNGLHEQRWDCSIWSRQKKNLQVGNLKNDNIFFFLEVVFTKCGKVFGKKFSRSLADEKIRYFYAKIIP
jgi:hypothetical protein